MGKIDCNVDGYNVDGYICFDIKIFEERAKIAAFDYDHTLVKPHKGTFSLDKDDWVWLRKHVPERVKSLYTQGFSIVIFTNQSKSFKVEQIKHVLETLDIPMRVYIGVSKDTQKPNTFLWNRFMESVSSNTTVDMKKSFYVGDALGRVGDWSDSDKVFAHNIDLQIMSPEDVFPFEERVHVDFVPLPSQEIVLMMGYPGSGKTYFTTNHIPDTYTKLHGDELKTDAKKKKYLKLAH